MVGSCALVAESCQEQSGMRAAEEGSLGHPGQGFPKLWLPFSTLEIFHLVPVLSHAFLAGWLVPPHAGSVCF